jgi:hypothetical protein
MKKTLSIVIIIIILILISMMAFGVLNQKEEVEKMNDRERILEEEQVPTRTIEVKHQFKDSAHTFVGTIDLPTPCHGLETVVKEDEGLYEIGFMILPPADDVMCAQVVTPTPYSVTVSVPEDASFIMTVDGEVVNVNQFEVPPAQDINNYDILIKG